MKKSIFTSFAFAASLALVSCGGSAEKAETTQDSVAAPEAPAAEAKAEQPKEAEKVGPVEVDLENFKCKVPEGWKVTGEKAGNYARLEIEPLNKEELAGKIKTNFGFSMEIVATNFGDVDKKYAEAEKQYNGGVDKSEKTFGGIKYKVFHCDAAKTGGAGISDRLVAPLKEKGVIDVKVRSLGLEDPAVKEFLESIVLLK